MSDSGSMSSDSMSSSMSTSMSSSSATDSHSDHHSDAPAHTAASAAADQDRDFHDYVTSPHEPSGEGATATGSPIGDGGQTGVTHPADGEQPAGYSTGVQDHGAVASVPTQHDKDVATWMEQAAQIAKAVEQQEEIDAMPTLGDPRADTLQTLDDAAHSVLAAIESVTSRALGNDEHDVQADAHGARSVGDLAGSAAMTKGSGGASLPGQESPQQTVDKAQSGR